MKKIIYIVLGILVFVAVALFGLLQYTKSFSPFVEAKFNEGNLDIKVAYCQPKKKGREIFGKLVPYSQVWRTGANASTTITFAQDTQVGNKKVPKGEYSLFTIPEKDKWTIIINKTVGDWGAFSYKEANDLMRVEVPATTTNTVVEMFTISFQKAGKGVDMWLKWDKTAVAVNMQ